MSASPPSRDPAQALGDLVGVIARLRGPNGCPWDRAQTHRSLVPYLLEEAYEAAAALADGAAEEEMREELGDVLLQVLLHAQIEAEAGRFGIGDVADALREKLIRRHPHVFGGGQAGTADEVRLRWEEIKGHEARSTENQPKPALLAAAKLVEIKKAQGDPIPTGVHLRLPPSGPDGERVLGEILLEAVAVARDLGCDPELALQRAVSRERGRG